MYAISYVGDGIQTEFSFSFPFFQVADVCVTLTPAATDDASGEVATDTPADAFSIVPNDDFTGGVVVFSQPPCAGTNIDIVRQISLRRVIDYQPTAPIDPENLNADFNFLLAAFQDLRGIDIDLGHWKTVHTNMVRMLEQTHRLILDKLTGGGVLGLYNNLLSVLASAQPYLITDYGSVADVAPTENRDDYGIL